MSARKTAITALLIASFICAPQYGLLPGAAPAYAFGEFTISDEAELGKKFNVLVRSRMPLVMDPEIVNYFQTMVDRLSANMPKQPFPFRVSVICNNVVNAFAVPGGYIFIHTGLINAMDHESEVAGVLSHEMAHVTQRHIASRVEKSQQISILTMLGVLAGALIGKDAGQAAIMGSAAAGTAAILNYSRADESEADQVGMSYLVAAGYPPQGMMNAFQILQRPQWTTGYGEIPSYLSTHPAIATRITDMRSKIAQMPASVQKRSEKDTEYLRIQALIRGRYAEPESARHYFLQQEKGPNKCVAYLGEGVLYNRLNKVADAEVAFAKAVQCNPNDSMTIREAGIFHYMKGNTARAEDLLNQAMRLNAHDYMALFFIARLQVDQGNLREAENSYKKILRYVPEDSEVHYYYAQCLGKSDQLFKAYLHLAYSALYSNDKSRITQYLGKAQGLAKDTAQKQDLERFDEIYSERSKYW